MAGPSVPAPFQRDRHDHQECVSSAVEAAHELCARRRIRLTELRRRVLELVWGGHAPIGAYEILDTLRGERRGAAPATVYRALDFLRENGLVHRIESLNAFVGCGAPRHSHSGQFLICGACDTVAEMDDGEIAGVLSRNAAKLGFRVDRQTVELTGLCPACAAAAG